MMRRRSAMVLGAAIMLIGAACGGGATEECQDYLTDFAALVVPAGDVLLERAEEFRAYQAGEIQLDQLTVALATSAAEMEALLEEIDALGQPPPEHTDGVELVISGIAKLREAFALDVLDLATDADLLDEYETLTAEGVDLLDKGTEAMGTCPVD